MELANFFPLTLTLSPIGGEGINCNNPLMLLAFFRQKSKGLKEKYWSIPTEKQVSGWKEKSEVFVDSVNHKSVTQVSERLLSFSPV
jgi:hypothetical protein